MFDLSINRHHQSIIITLSMTSKHVYNGIVVLVEHVHTIRCSIIIHVGVVGGCGWRGLVEGSAKLRSSWYQRNTERPISFSWFNFHVLDIICSTDSVHRTWFLWTMTTTTRRDGQTDHFTSSICILGRSTTLCYCITNTHTHTTHSHTHTPTHIHTHTHTHTHTKLW